MGLDIPPKSHLWYFTEKKFLVASFSRLKNFQKKFCVDLENSWLPHVLEIFCLFFDAIRFQLESWRIILVLSGSGMFHSCPTGTKTIEIKNQSSFLFNLSIFFPKNMFNSPIFYFNLTFLRKKSFSLNGNKIMKSTYIKHQRIFY